VGVSTLLTAAELAMEKDLTVIIHLYYPGSWHKVREKCAYLLEQAAKVIITACHDDLIEEVDLPRVSLLRVTNKGKDIGGKLVSLAYYLSFCSPTKYIAFLHDKISPQTINAGFWFNRLFDIFEQRRLGMIMNIFRKRDKVGVAGSKYFLKNEYIKRENKFDTTNDFILRQLIRQFRLKCLSYRYIGGTVFIARSEIFKNFFTAHGPLEIREQLEPGNVLDLKSGTFTHSWERMFCFIAQAQGYQVIGV
jgi:hypothetical protein